jgi:acetolactate synthase regulatory subunit
MATTDFTLLSAKNIDITVDVRQARTIEVLASKAKNLKNVTKITCFQVETAETTCFERRWAKIPLGK